MQIERSELRQGLLNLLELYQRCGITHLPTLADESSAKWAQALIENMSHDSSRPALAASRPVQIANQPSRFANSNNTGDSSTLTATDQMVQTVAQQTVTQSGPDRRSSSIDVAADGTGAAAWTLPVLPLAEREQRFREMHERIKACRLCTEIVSFRRQTVLGDGTLQPTICFFGEAPGADEDRVGLPFVGKAGQLLNRIIDAMSLRRGDVYILNALKCRPPQNRTPMPDEIDNCRPFVESQLEILQPKFIVCLGAVAVRSILNSTASIGQLRGRFHRYRDARVVVTYHPAYLLRNESAKKLVWEDMQMLMQELGLKPRKQ